jgi:hypothetical protein
MKPAYGRNFRKKHRLPISRLRTLDMPVCLQGEQVAPLVLLAPQPSLRQVTVSIDYSPQHAVLQLLPELAPEHVPQPRARDHELQPPFAARAQVAPPRLVPPSST